MTVPLHLTLRRSFLVVVSIKMAVSSLAPSKVMGTVPSI